MPRVVRMKDGTVDLDDVGTAAGERTRVAPIDELH